MGHREKLEARRKELVEALAPLQNELSEIDELLGTYKKERDRKREEEEQRIRAMSAAASHADWCNSKDCLGQCKVR
jgi:uncharacterized coiled-coil DUF342 family protein